MVWRENTRGRVVCTTCYRERQALFDCLLVLRYRNMQPVFDRNILNYIAARI